MKKIKLLIYAKSIDGGTGTFIEALERIKKIQTEVLVTQKPQYRKIKYQNYHYCFNQKKYSERYSPSLLLPFYLFKERLWLDKKIKKFRPNIILTVDAHCLLVYSVFRQSSAKLIATIHNHLVAVINYRVSLLFRGVVMKLLQFYLNKADRVVCVSKGLVKNIRKEFKLHRTPTVIYYGINKVTKISLKSRDRLNKPILLSVGRFCEQKDFLTIIKAFSIVKLKVPQSQLWLVGDGPQKHILQNYIQKNKISGVIFLGWQQNLYKIYQKASVFVFASNWEGFGWVILEAMNFGLPIVATNTDFGPREILDWGKYGILVNAHSETQLANKIHSLLTIEGRISKYSAASLARTQVYGLSRMLSEYNSLFDHI